MKKMYFSGYVSGFVVLLLVCAMFMVGNAFAVTDTVQATLIQPAAIEEDGMDQTAQITSNIPVGEYASTYTDSTFLSYIFAEGNEVAGCDAEMSQADNFTGAFVFPDNARFRNEAAIDNFKVSTEEMTTAQEIVIAEHPLFGEAVWTSLCAHVYDVAAGNSGTMVSVTAGFCVIMMC